MNYYQLLLKVAYDLWKRQSQVFLKCAQFRPCLHGVGEPGLVG